MTEEEIKAIETHTEIHAKAEPRAIKITEILRKAVRELRENKHLEEEMEIMTGFCGACKKKHEDEIETLKHNKKTVAHLSNCISDIQDKKIVDLENKISGLEERCEISQDEVSRLMQENAELNDKLNNWVKCAELRLANWQKYEKENERLALHIVELQKDKGELTDKVKELKKVNNTLFNSTEKVGKRNNELSGQLEQAKEHIRTLISCLIDWVQESDKDYCYIADAEQFLKETSRS